MSTQSQSGGITEYGKLTGNTVTTIFTATQNTPIQSIVCCENNGGTPNLTVEVYDVDNTTSYYKRKAVAMTAGSETIFNEPFTLPHSWAIRLTSSDASGRIDWSITYGGTPAAGSQRPK